MFLFVVFCKVGALERTAIDFRSNIFSLTSKLNESINHLTKNPEKKGLKARIHCEIFFSDYFIKNRLTHISLHIIGFHEIHVKYVKANPSRTIMLFSQIILPEMKTKGIHSLKNSAVFLQ